MAVGNVLVNDTVRIKVKFVDLDPVTGEQVEVSPLSVSVKIFNSDNLEIISTTAISLTSSEYYYDYTPLSSGQYQVRFVGTFANNRFITVNQQLYVSTPTEDYRPVVTLKEQETITFAPDIEPLYVDPESILLFYPDSSLLEIGELIHLYSHEVNQIFGIANITANIDAETGVMQALENNGISTFSIVEYIKASVLCQLTKIYGFGGDDELSLELADFKITNRNTPKTSINRANATTWCQVAAALRKEIMTKRVSARGIVPKGLPAKKVIPSGASVDPQTGALIYINDTAAYGPRDTYRTGVTTVGESEDPMPDRGIKRYD